MPPEGDSGSSGGLAKKTVLKWVKSVPLGRKDWTVGTLFTAGGALVAFANDPIGFLRSELAPMVVGGILDAFAPIIDGLLFVFVGTEIGYPGYPPGPGVTYGVTDLPLLVADIMLSPILTLMRLGVSGLIDINQLIVPSGTPFGALVVYALLVVETLIFAEVSTRLLRAVLDSFPVTSGVETFLFGGD